MPANSMSDPKEEPKVEVVVASGHCATGTKTKIVHRMKSGLFAKKPKPPSPVEIQRAIASKLTEPLDDSGTSHAEQVLNAQLAIAKDTSIDRGTGATKAAEFVFKAAGMLAPNPAPQQEKPLTVVIYDVDLRDKDGNPRPILREEDAYKKPTQPAWLLEEGKTPPTIEATFTEDKKS